MPTTALTICNLALGEVPHKSIASLDEQSLAAAKCNEHYPQARDELFARHDWEFLAARVALAAVANDRPSEWFFAYALPADCATPHRVLAPQNGAAGDYRLVGQRPAPALGGWSGDPLLVPFAIAAGTLYTNQSGAVLDYSRNTVSEAAFPPAFTRALALDLATRIVMPLIKSRTRQGDLINAAEAQRARAIAEDRNRVASFKPDYVSEAARARGCC